MYEVSGFHEGTLWDLVCSTLARTLELGFLFKIGTLMSRYFIFLNYFPSIIEKNLKIVGSKVI